MAYIRILMSISLSISAERERSTGDRATDCPSPQTPIIGSCSALAMVPLQLLTPSAAYESN